MSTLPGFEGDIEQWYFECGDGTWTNDPVVPCGDNDEFCNVYPDTDGCVILYEECNFQGKSSRICNDQPFTDVDYEVKSIAVPELTTVYLYNMPCFNGESAAVS